MHVDRAAPHAARGDGTDEKTPAIHADHRGSFCFEIWICYALFNAAWAAANRAIGTRNGEQLT